VTENRRPSRKSRPTKIMMSPGAVDDADNPFVPMLIDSLADRVMVIPFSWAGAFCLRYDVLHIHWPERLTKHPNRARAALKAAAFILLMCWNRLRRVSNVATVHNIDPHEGTGKFERLVLTLWTRSCRSRIFLSKAGLDADSMGNGVHIPHGDYAPFLLKLGRAPQDATPDSVLTFGYLRPYKGIEKLLRLIHRDGPLRLVVAGKPLSQSYANTLEELAILAGEKTVELVPRSLSPEMLVDAIARAEVVILPYSRIYNSGAALLALSSGRPLIVTKSPSIQELQSEVGDEWVTTLQDSWEWADVLEAVEVLRANASRRGAVPLFDSRSWDSVSAAHVKLYEELCPRVENKNGQGMK
jgi:beta-1,4-mannosyltransferase